MFEMIPFDHSFRRAAAFDPFREMDNLSRALVNSGCAVSNFRTDVSDRGDAFVLECELPGFKKEDISIDVKEELLTVSAERKLDNEEKKAGFVRRERFYGSFSRSFDVTGLDTEGIEARYEDGVLTITLPKKTEEIPESHRIEIM